MGKDTKTIKEQLNRNFNCLCEWFIDKLSIHFGEEKTIYSIWEKRAPKKSDKS